MTKSSFLTTKAFGVMGILNITPDSFYDGGKYFHRSKDIINRAATIIHEGGSIIDVGGESTRPGSLPISIDEELSRIIPAIEQISARFDVTLSVDTRKSAVAKSALEAGAHWINDVSAGRFDPHMPQIVADAQATIVIVHSRNTPTEMQEAPSFADCITEVRTELHSAVDIFLKAGVQKERIILDPGIGFAKRYEDNLILLQKCHQLVFDNYPLLLAASRKQFIATAIESENRDRLAGGLAAIGMTYAQGVRLFRVHDVQETVDYLRVLSQIENGGVN